MRIKNQLMYIMFLAALLSAQENQMAIDGLAAIVDNNIILKSDVAQLVQMTAIQQRINPELEPERLVNLQKDILQSMVDQKIILEMAKLDSIEVKEKEVDQALDQQIEYMISQAGSEELAEEMLGQSLKSLRREYQQDMRDRMITERYQQQLLMSITVSRQEVVDFFNTYKDSIPFFPTRVHLWHLLTKVEAGKESLQKARLLISDLRKRIINGESFEDLARDYSQDPGSAANGGSLGLIRRESLVPEFGSVAFTLSEGEISQPVKTQFGYHLIQTMKKQAEKIQVRHILITPEISESDESRAYQFASNLKDSISTIDDFSRLSQIYTKDDETRGRGGDLGWVNPQEFPIPEVAQIINYLEMNECSRPVKTNFGYHLFWIEDIKIGGKPDLSRHWTDLEMMAVEHRKADWYSEWIAKARQNFFIQIMD